MAFNIYFVKATRKDKGVRRRKTPSWILRKDSDHAYAEYLGIVKFSGRWRQFIFQPENDFIWSSVCLKTVTSFLDDVNKKCRNNNKRKN